VTINATRGMPRPTATPLVPLLSLKRVLSATVEGHCGPTALIELRLEIRGEVEEHKRGNPQIAGISTRGMLRKRNGVVSAGCPDRLLKAGVASPSSNNGEA
jgi:hypothetical protein